MKKAARVLAALCAALLTVSCSAGSREKFSTSFIDLFDTAATVIAYAKDEAAFASMSAGFHDELAEYNELYDIYNEYDGVNNMKTINRNAGTAPVKVDQRIIDLLVFGKEMYELSGGKVNVAFGAVLEVWHNYREFGMNDPEDAELPPMEKLSEAAMHTDINDVIIDEENSTVYLADPEMSLDVGAIAKGYAVERVCQWARENGWDSAAVSIGGNVRTLDGKVGGESWSIGIEDPDGGQYVHTLLAENISIVTSGDYQRYYTVDGERYHHLIDPDTLMPARYASAVTVVAEDSGFADGMSTALFLMEPEDGLAMVESLDGVEALWIFEDGSEQMSSGYAAYIKQ